MLAPACSESDFLANLVSHGVEMEQVVTAKGYYDRTCTPETSRCLGGKAAIMMIDCDSYESTVPGPDFLTDLVQQVTIVLFDDGFRFEDEQMPVRSELPIRSFMNVQNGASA